MEDFDRVNPELLEIFEKLHLGGNGFSSDGVRSGAFDDLFENHRGSRSRFRQDVYPSSSHEPTLPPSIHPTGSLPPEISNLIGGTDLESFRRRSYRPPMIPPTSAPLLPRFSSRPVFSPAEDFGVLALIILGVVAAVSFIAGSEGFGILVFLLMVFLLHSLADGSGNRDDGGE